MAFDPLGDGLSALVEPKMIHIKLKPMNKFSLLLILSILLFSPYADAQKINFKEMSYAEVLSSLSDADGMACLYFHFQGCGACARMEKEVFTLDSVAEFFNAQFLNVSVDTRSPQGIKVNEHFGITMHPTFVFLDKNGNIVHQTQFSDAKLFMAHARRALNPESSLQFFKNEYAEGNRDPQFLFEYSYMMRDAGELDSSLVLDYLNSQSYEDLDLEKNRRYIYEFCLLPDFSQTITVNHPAYRHLLEKRLLYGEIFDQKQVDIRILFLSVDAMAVTMDVAEFDRLNQNITDFMNQGEQYFELMDGRTMAVMDTDRLDEWMRLKLYQRMGEEEKYHEMLKQWVAVFWNNWEKLNEHAWMFVQVPNSTEKEIIHAIECVRQSIAIEANYFNLDTYAHLLELQGKNEEAMKHALRAVAKAQKASISHKTTDRLIERLNMQ